MFDKDNLMRVDFVKVIGGTEIDMVALYNKRHVSQEDVREVIHTEEEHPHVIITTAKQFKNVFIKVLT
jgi:hypothetical protein